MSVFGRALELQQEDGLTGVKAGIQRWWYYRFHRHSKNARSIWLRVRHGSKIHKNIHGSTLQLDLDAPGIHTDLAVYGTREPEAITYYEQRLQEIAASHGDVLVLDIGSNIGHYALLAANQLPDGHIVAIEPDLRNIDYLETNVELNDYENIETRHFAVGDTSGEVQFNIAAEANLNHVAIVDAGIESIDQILVDLTTVDSLLEEFAPDTDTTIILRTDVEGYESSIIDGATKLLNSDRRLFLFIEIHESFIDDEIYKEMLNKLEGAGLNLEMAESSLPHENPSYFFTWKEYKKISGLSHLFASRGIDS